mmetsp:Transcript_23309/g.37948  ORF Transcript_23309/g.37948 Transcript_23309/m.37948 type:complete len:224 (-) Transcript_23309:223-894(-)
MEMMHGNALHIPTLGSVNSFLHSWTMSRTILLIHLRAGKRLLVKTLSQKQMGEVLRGLIRSLLPIMALFLLRMATCLLLVTLVKPAMTLQLLVVRPTQKTISRQRLLSRDVSNVHRPMGLALLLLLKYVRHAKLVQQAPLWMERVSVCVTMVLLIRGILIRLMIPLRIIANRVLMVKSILALPITMVPEFVRLHVLPPIHSTLPHWRMVNTSFAARNLSALLA